MKRSDKKLFALLMTLIMIISMLPMGVFAADCAHDNLGSVKVVYKAATCTTDGEYRDQVVCLDCGKAFSRFNKNPDYAPIPAAHSPAVVPGYAATCTESGMTDGSKCSACNETLVAQEVIGAKGHTNGTPVIEDKIDVSDCTTNGSYVEVINCTVCGTEVSRESKVIEAPGHDTTTVTVTVSEATCTEPAVKRQETTCSRCDYFKAGPEYTIGQALGHDTTTVTVTVSEATCTEPAVKRQETTCSRCDYFKAGPEYTSGEALGHTPGEWEEDVTAPTCEKDGLKITSRHCVTCGVLWDYDEDILPATGHNYGWVYDVVIKEATCTEAGEQRDMYMCLTEGCGKIKNKQPAEVIPATGHVETSTFTQEPTCTVDGFTTTTCNACGVELSKEVLPATGNHIFIENHPAIPACQCLSCKQMIHNSDVTIPAVDATCIADGLTEGKQCSKCGETTVAQKVVPATGKHDYYYLIKEVPATCTEKPYVWYQCKTPGCDSVKGREEGIALGHDFNKVLEAVAPTCTETGLTEGLGCTRCDEISKAQEVVAALGHTEEVVPAIAPTCVATGMTEGKICSVCDEVLVAQEVVPAAGHSLVENGTKVIKEPTCLEKGQTNTYYKCENCNFSKTDISYPAAKGHNTETVETVMVEATCTEGGTVNTKEICKDCHSQIGATVLSYTPALGHTETVDVAVAPTCEATGLTEGSHCSVCNEVLTAQEEVAALGHKWDAGKVTKEPTANEKGIKTFTCQNDATHTKTEDIAALGNATSNAGLDDVPKTGDASDIFMLGGMLTVALFGAAVLLISARKRTNH